MRKLLPLLALVLSGCFSLTGKNAPAVVNYVLQDKIVASPAVAPSDPRSLLVLDTTTTAFYDDENLVYSSAPGTRSQYQYARWTERPGRRLMRQSETSQPDGTHSRHQTASSLAHQRTWPGRRDRSRSLPMPRLKFGSKGNGKTKLPEVSPIQAQMQEIKATHLIISPDLPPSTK